MRWFSGCVLLGAAASCTPPEGARQDTGTAASGAAAVASPTADSMPADSLSFTIEAPAQAALGEVVPVVLRLANVSARRVEVHLRGRETVFDVVVRRAGGEEVWRRLAGQVTPAILQLRPLAPGEVLRFRATWDQRDGAGQPVAPGEYVMEGELPGDDRVPLRSAEARLVIAPR